MPHGGRDTGITWFFAGDPEALPALLENLPADYAVQLMTPTCENLFSSQFGVDKSVAKDVTSTVLTEENVRTLTKAVQGNPRALEQFRKNMDQEFPEIAVKLWTPSCEKILSSKLGLDVKTAKDVTSELLTEDNCHLVAKIVEGDPDAHEQFMQEMDNLPEHIMVVVIRRRFATHLELQMKMSSAKADKISHAFVTVENAEYVKRIIDGDEKALKQFEEELPGLIFSVGVACLF